MAAKAGLGGGECRQASMHAPEALTQQGRVVSLCAEGVNMSSSLPFLRLLPFLLGTAVVSL